MPKPVVRTGLDRLLSDQISLLKGKRVGLICNASSITSDFVHAADALAGHTDVDLVQLFGPEHGIRGDAQDMIPVSGERVDRITGLPLHSLYGRNESSLWPPKHMVENLDVLVFDIQDVGARYYTYAYTMAHAMEIAGQVGVPVIVCDRPNPIGGLQVEGNVVQDGYRSFVGRYRLPNRHGMTVGELSSFFQEEEGIECEVEVVRMEGWNRSMYFEDTGLPWVLPSPNMPTVDTAVVYPGGCLLEGTLLSEGRGQTRPFEIVGAPYIHPQRWADVATEELHEAGYGGFVLRPLVFLPTFQKHHGQACGGVQVHVTDRLAFHSLMTYVGLLKAAWRLWPGKARWRTHTYEFVSDPIAIDLLDGSPSLRSEVEEDVPLKRIAARWEDERAEFDARRKRYLEYPDGAPKGRARASAKASAKSKTSAKSGSSAKSKAKSTPKPKPATKPKAKAPVSPEPLESVAPNDVGEETLSP